MYSSIHHTGKTYKRILVYDIMAKVETPLCGYNTNKKQEWLCKSGKAASKNK
jgi:hypothetical protein